MPIDALQQASPGRATTGCKAFLYAPGRLTGQEQATPSFGGRVATSANLGLRLWQLTAADPKHCRWGAKGVGDQPETVVVVPVVRVVVVADRHARLPLVVVPRAAAHHAATCWLVPTQGPAPIMPYLFSAASRPATGRFRPPSRPRAGTGAASANVNPGRAADKSAAWSG